MWKFPALVGRRSAPSAPRSGFPSNARLALSAIRQRAVAPPPNVPLGDGAPGGRTPAPRRETARWCNERRRRTDRWLSSAPARAASRRPNRCVKKAGRARSSCSATNRIRRTIGLRSPRTCCSRAWISTRSCCAGRRRSPPRASTSAPESTSFRSTAPPAKSRSIWAAGRPTRVSWSPPAGPTAGCPYPAATSPGFLLCAASTTPTSSPRRSPARRRCS